VSYCLLIIALLSGAIQAQVQSSPGKTVHDSVRNAIPATGKAQDERDPLLDPPPLPEGQLSLVGGTLIQVNRLRDRILVKPFGGREMEIAFDQRTEIFRDNDAIAARDLQSGSQVYVDTLADGSRIFAKSIRVRSQNACSEMRGQVIGYDSGKGMFEVSERISPYPVRLRVTPRTVVLFAGRNSGVSDIPVGSLVTVSFAPGPDDTPIACDVRVLATPGQVFTFAGTITFVDLRLKSIAVTNRSDQRSYMIGLGSLLPAEIRRLREGANATIQALFDGRRYQARAVEIVPSSPQSEN
jgi:hypothetical protein